MNHEHVVWWEGGGLYLLVKPLLFASQFYRSYGQNIAKNLVKSILIQLCKTRTVNIFPDQSLIINRFTIPWKPEHKHSKWIDQLVNSRNLENLDRNEFCGRGIRT